MYVCVFIDWENIEKTAKQEYGSIIIYDEFIKVIRAIATSNNSRLVGVQAYGDFDKGTEGLMSKLVNLGIEPHHVVTKTAKEYLKGSTDIELSLDILDTMYNYPHITDFCLISGDSDLRYVSKRLKKNGKSVTLIGFEDHTSQFLIEMVDKFIPLNKYENIMHKISKSEKEQMAESLISNKYVHILIRNLDTLEKEKRDFIGLNYLRKRLIDYYKDEATQISDVLTDCIDYGILDIYFVQNPNDINHPTKACKLNRQCHIVDYALNK